MEFDDVEDTKMLYFTVNIAVFVVFICIVLVTLCKVKFKLDKLAILTISMFTISITIRMINWVLCITLDRTGFIDYVEVFILVSAIIIWIILCYFTFELQSFKDKLESQTVKEYQVKASRLRKRKIFFIIAISIAYTGIAALAAYRIMQKKNPYKFVSVLSMTNLTVNVIKGVLDLYMFILFSLLFFYFIEKKQEKLKHIGQEISIFNKFIVYWTILLILTNVIVDYGQIVLKVMLFTRISDQVQYKDIDKTVKFLIVPIEDFLTATTLVFLFYQQSIISQKQRGQRVGGDDAKSITTNNVNLILTNQKDTSIFKSNKVSKSTQQILSSINTTSINNEDNQDLLGGISRELSQNMATKTSQRWLSSGEDSSQLSDFLYEQIAIYKKNLNYQL